MGNDSLLLRYLTLAFELGRKRDSEGFMNLLRAFQDTLTVLSRDCEDLEVDSSKLARAFAAGLTGDEGEFKRLVPCGDERLAREVYGIVMRREFELRVDSQSSREEDDRRYRELMAMRKLGPQEFKAKGNGAHGRRECIVPMGLVNGTFTAGKFSRN